MVNDRPPIRGPNPAAFIRAPEPAREKKPAMSPAPSAPISQDLMQAQAAKPNKETARRSLSVGAAAAIAPPQLPGPFKLDDAQRYRSGAQVAMKQKWDPQLQARYENQALKRRQQAGLKMDLQQMPLAQVTTRHLARAKEQQIVRASAFANGAYSSVADAMLVSQQGNHRAVVLKKVSLAPGASRARLSRPALLDQSVRQAEQELRTQATYEPRLAPLHVLSRWGVMEAVMGERFAGSLKQLASSLRANASAAAVAPYVGAHLFDGLARLHADGLIHRDVKLDNLFVSYPNRKKPSLSRVVLGDYGLLLDTLHEVAKEQSGSPGYYAPEIFAADAAGKAQPAYTVAVDVWSAGVSLLAILDPDSKTPFEEGGAPGVQPAAYADYAVWRTALLNQPGPLTEAKLGASTAPFAAYFLPKFRDAPELVDFLLRQVVVPEPADRLGAAACAAHFHGVLRQPEAGREGRSAAADKGAAAVADIDRLTADKTRQRAQFLYVQADLKAAADVLAGLDDGAAGLPKSPPVR
jgi:serine/threonine protein kinase